MLLPAPLFQQPSFAFSMLNLTRKLPGHNIEKIAK